MPRIPYSVLRALSRPPKSLPSNAFIQATARANATMIPARQMTSLILSSLPTKFQSTQTTLHGGLARSLLPAAFAQQSRTRTFGTEYQPSQRKRKRKFGFLARLKSIGGRKVLKRRLEKGRKRLSH